ncbi:hypothetical protein KAR10_06760 [bacterium]|nr:hypothetical protein [bacterium]
MIKKIGLLLFMIQIFLIGGIMGEFSQVYAQNPSPAMTDEEFSALDDEIINPFLDDIIQIFLIGEVIGGFSQANSKNPSQAITDEEFLEVDDEIINSCLDEMIINLLILENEMDQKQSSLKFATK